MPSFASTPSTLPAPVATVVINAENVIGGTKVTVTRAGTVYALSAFVSGDATGADRIQNAKLALYSHDAGLDRPLTKLAETAARSVRKSDGVTGVGPVPLLVPAVVAPGTYWVCAHLDTISGNGTWQIHGIIGGGRSISGTPALYASGVPTPYPAGGAASTNRTSLAGVFTPSGLTVSGSIVGTFIVGDGTLVGEPPIAHHNEAILKLNGKAFITNVFTGIEIAQPGKGELLLNAEPFTIEADSTLVMGKPELLLNGGYFDALVPTFSHHAKPWLTLNGKAFSTPVDSTINPGKPWLLLRGKTFQAQIPTLFPTTPEAVDLVPTTPESEDLVPTTPESIDLVPTIVEFR